MKCSLDIPNCLEELSSLFHSIISLYFFALTTEESFLIPLCYSLECILWNSFNVSNSYIKMGISFLFSFAFCFFSFHSYLQGLPRQPFCFFALHFHEDGLDPCLLYNVMNLVHSSSGTLSIRSSSLNLFLTFTV